MSLLLLSFLGQFHVTLDGQIVRRFEIGYAFSSDIRQYALDSDNNRC